MPLIMMNGKPHRVIAGEGLIGSRPSDGTPAVVGGECVRMGPRSQLPEEAGTSEAAEARCDD